MEESVIKLEHIRKCYGKNEVLKDVTMDVKKGDIYGLIGQNGSGKSTLFKVILGMTEYQNGTIALLGDTRNLEKNRREMGFFIGSDLFGYMNAKQNLDYFAKLKGLKNYREEIDEILEMVGLKGVKTRVKGYSLGMRQRLGIGVAMLGKPQVLILDEPINGLDPQGIIDVRNLIRRMNEEYGMTIIVSSHILSELQNTATRFGIVNKGIIVREISEQELIDEENVVRLKVSDLKQAREALEREGIEILKQTMEEKSLESFYFSLIGGGKNE